MLFGGRAAEELIFGPEKITTGAGNDIERATAMARRMVTQFGMSDVIGPMAVGDAEQESLPRPRDRAAAGNFGANCRDRRWRDQAHPR